MELRRDYILDRWVILSDIRGQRPNEFNQDHQAKLSKSSGEKNQQAEQPGKSSTCFFCAGNEHLTPPEIARQEKNGKWNIRIFPNKFPAVKMEGTSEIRTDNDFFTFSNPYGRHEVIVETPDHGKQLHDLSEEEIFDVLNMYSQRSKELSLLPGSKYVVLFKNFGKEGGTSLVHSHTQMLSLNKVPVPIEQEVIAIRQWRQERHECPYCRIISIEKGSFRRCFESKYFVAFTPYASRYQYEIWLFPKDHRKSIAELNFVEMRDFAEIFHKVLVKLKELGTSYNFFMHQAPSNEDSHFHFEFVPRMATFAGFEISTDAIINSVYPEDAAKFYRGEK